jgi:hypothetical protein
LKPHKYSSLAALLAHYRILSAAAGRDAAAFTPDERATLTAIERALAELCPADRSALLAPASDSATARRRERAELKLRRLLNANGLLAG